MTKRLEIIFSEIPVCDSFADVGCDHGIIAERMIARGGLKKLVVSDISAKSLEKAKKRLEKCERANESEIEAVVCDGLEKVSPCDCVLIAGMGGEEIDKILLSAPFLPHFLVLQPMKNTPKVRKTVISLGYGIKKDYIFKDKKFYNLLVCEKGVEMRPYTNTEFEFGRDNLKNYSPDFIEYVKTELKNAKKYVKGVVSLCDLADLNQRITLLTEILGNEN
ncbi:MAG: class I SAM-dependent methyltransferase [Candidatus Borkfalkiaceae bacterium]|nr:class I SAM-dependent methyltransferase [Christensenellaceae bacterium]